MRNFQWLSVAFLAGWLNMVSANAAVDVNVLDSATEEESASPSQAVMDDDSRPANAVVPTITPTPSPTPRVKESKPKRNQLGDMKRLKKRR